MQKGFSIADLQGIDEQKEKWSLKEISVDKIIPNPEQPRKELGNLEELASSIKKNGVIQPVQVCVGEGGKYVLIFGERRWRATKKAGLQTIPCVIVPAAEQSKIRTLLENLYRKDLTPIEQAEAYDIWLRLEDKKEVNLAEELGLTRAAVNAILQIMKLPLDVRDELRGVNVSARVVRAILKESSEIQRPLAKAIKRAVNNDIEVTEASLGTLKERLDMAQAQEEKSTQDITKEEKAIGTVKTAIISLMRKDREAFLSLAGKTFAMNALKQYWKEKDIPQDKETMVIVEKWYKERKGK